MEFGPEAQTKTMKPELTAAAGALSVQESVEHADHLPPMPKPHTDPIERNKGVNPVYGEHVLPLGPYVVCGPLLHEYSY